MIDEICANVKNYFVYPRDIHVGDWTITNGIITPLIDFPTDYIRIVDSRLNDGVHKVSEMELQDEAFHGGIWIMSPPKDFLLLVAEIEQWQEKNGAFDSIAMSPFTSETLGAYSYSKGSSGNYSSGSGDGGASWKDVYASRLHRYRKARIL